MTTARKQCFLYRFISQLIYAFTIRRETYNVIRNIIFIFFFHIKKKYNIVITIMQIIIQPSILLQDEIVDNVRRKKSETYSCHTRIGLSFN